MIVQGAGFHEVGASHNNDGLRLVSLGCYCGPKLSFRKLGRDAETLPFDWIRSRIDGILDFLQNDFDKFFHYDSKLPNSVGGTGKPMFIYRSYYHSFWHDDLSDPSDVEKLKRRIARFKAIDARSSPVLFVRAVANDAEIQYVGLLSQELSTRFGRNAKLLVIVDFQPTEEALVIQGCDNLLVYKLTSSAHGGQNGEAPYVTPISAAIAWAKAGHAQGARAIQSLSSENFSSNKMAWLAPSLHEPFETMPKGGMKPLTSLALNSMPQGGHLALAAPVAAQQWQLLSPPTSGAYSQTNDVYQHLQQSPQQLQQTPLAAQQWQLQSPLSGAYPQTNDVYQHLQQSPQMYSYNNDMYQQLQQTPQMPFSMMTSLPSQNLISPAPSRNLAEQVAPVSWSRCELEEKLPSQKMPPAEEIEQSSSSEDETCGWLCTRREQNSRRWGRRGVSANDAEYEVSRSSLEGEVSHCSRYRVVFDNLPVTATIDRESCEVTRLRTGTTIEVFEIVDRSIDGRFRGRIRNPDGWVSLKSSSAQFAVTC